MTYSVSGATSVHTRINKKVLRAATLAAMEKGVSRSQIINQALISYLAKTKATTKARKAK